MKEEKWGTYKVSIDKIGRKWTQVTVHYPSGYTHSANIDKNSLADHVIGDEIDVPGCLEIENNGYGKKYTLIATGEDALVEKQVERWWGYFEDNYKKGKIYERAITEMHALGCHYHDLEIRQAKCTLSIKRWITDFRYSYQCQRFDQYAVDRLHELDCHEYDNEIDNCRKDIQDKRQAAAEKKRLEVEKKKQAERDAGITRLSLPAYSGFRGRPEKGSIIMEDGVPYKVLSAYYHDSDGWSFGAMHDEWYDVKVQNISDTELGQKMIADEKHQKRLSALKKKCTQTLFQLERSIRNLGERYTGEEISECDIPGETLVNSFDIYGGGIIIRRTDDAIWLIVNNGRDGDAWDLNNIRTGGAGAYAFSVSLPLVKDAFQSYLDAKKEYTEYSSSESQLPPASKGTTFPFSYYESTEN